MPRRLAAALILSSLMLLVSCGSDSPDTGALTPAPVPTAAPGATGLPAGEASLRVVSPDDGETIASEPVEATPTPERPAPEGPESEPTRKPEQEFLRARIEVEVEGFELVNKMGEEAKGGEGHLIYYAWNGFGESPDYEFPTALGQPANAGGTGYVAAASHETTYDWSSFFVKPGPQLFAVQLVNNDHTPLDPPQTARVRVTLVE